MKHQYISETKSKIATKCLSNHQTVNMVSFKVIVLSVLVVVISAQEQANSANKLKKDCENNYSTTCLKLDVVSLIEKIGEQRSLPITSGITIEKENGSESGRANTADLVSELAREFPNDAEARLDAFLMKKVTGYLNSHSIKFKLFDDQAVVSARKKDKGGLGAIMAAILMMKGTLGALGFGALAALAGKALMTGLMALMLSAIVGLKSLAHSGHKQTTYEIVSKPIYSHAHTHSSSHEEAGHHGHYGYGRNLDIPIPLSIQNHA